MNDHLVGGLTSDVTREMQRFDVEVQRVTTGRDIPVGGEVEARLNADGFVRGEVRRKEARTSVHLEVVRAGGRSFWSHEYDVPDAALPGLARVIAADLAGAIGVRARAGASAQARPANYAAYDAYQRGRALWDERTPPSIKRALDYFKQAAALDPDYAAPWAGMADAYISLGVAAFGPLEPLDARRLAKESALKAIALDPDLAEAHTSLAFAAFFHDWDWATAETEFKKAIALNPQYALAHHWYTNHLNAMGRQSEAMTEILKAQELEPLSIIIHRDVAWHLFFQRKYDEAITHLEQTLQMDPGTWRRAPSSPAPWRSAAGIRRPSSTCGSRRAPPCNAVRI